MSFVAQVSPLRRACLRESADVAGLPLWARDADQSKATRLFPCGGLGLCAYVHCRAARLFADAGHARRRQERSGLAPTWQAAACLFAWPSLFFVDLLRRTCDGLVTLWRVDGPGVDFNIFVEGSVWLCASAKRARAALLVQRR